MRPNAIVRSFLMCCLALSLLWLLPARVATAAEFVRAGDLLQGRDMAMAAMLSDGRVLVTGGVGLDGQGNGVYLAASELFDPVSNSFEPTGAMHQGRDGNATFTPLSDGRVLVAGGISQAADNQTIALASAEVYDPATGQFEPVANEMSSVRYFHTATLLADGRVLVSGGWGAGERLASADIYDPATNRFTRTGDMMAERNSHTATALDDGRVLIAGGLTTDAEILSSAEIYDPATGHFSTTGNLAEPRFMATASRLEDGRVLVGGGLDNGAWRPYGELYDPATGQFSRTGALHWSRNDHAQTTLPDGRVLFTAGATDEGGSRRAERYDPVTGTFTIVANMQLGRARSATAVLADGRVLVAGGVRPWEPPLAIAEVYTPSPGPYADLALQMRASTANVPAGGHYHYLLWLENSGTEPAAQVGLDVELPAGSVVQQVKIAQSKLSGTWHCTQNATALSCVPADGVLRPSPNPKIPRPAVAIRIDMTAPQDGVPLVATAFASTSSNEDITANNETGVVLNLFGAGTRKALDKPARDPTVSRSRHAADDGAPHSH